MRHRYILCGMVSGSDKLSDFRLISKLDPDEDSFIRVNIPDDVKLNTFPGDGYSTTDCDKTLDELGYDCYIKYRNKWLKTNELKPYNPAHWYEVLEYGYDIRMVNGMGYGTKQDEKDWWAGNGNDEDVYVPFSVQDKKTKLVLQPQGEKHPFYEHIIKEEWFKKFNEINNLKQ